MSFDFTVQYAGTSSTMSIPGRCFCNISDLKLLGEGAFGQVYKYDDEVTGLSVALKRIPIHATGVEDEINDVMKEVEVHRKLTHKNIVHYIGCHEGSESLIILLEYMGKGSLKDKLNNLEKQRDGLEGKPLISCDDIMRYTNDIVCGLQFLHSERIIHRDLRSPNILLSSRDVAKISDFGICKEIDILATKSGFTGHAHIGNVFWRAPEMIDSSGNTRGRSVDIWSLGILILEMVYNVPPFMRGKDAAIPYMFRLCLKKERPDIPEFITDDVKNIVGKCLTLEADGRPSSEELLNLVNELYSSNVVTLPVKQVGESSVLTRHRHDYVMNQSEEESEMERDCAPAPCIPATVQPLSQQSRIRKTGNPYLLFQMNPQKLGLENIAPSNGRRRKTGINILQSNLNPFLVPQTFSQKGDLENTPPTSFASVQSRDSAHAVSHGKAVDSATQPLQEMTLQTNLNSNSRRRKTGITPLQANVNPSLLFQMNPQKLGLENTPPSSCASVPSTAPAQIVTPSMNQQNLQQIPYEVEAIAEMQEVREVESASQSLQEMTSKPTETGMPMRNSKRPNLQTNLNSNSRRRKTAINALQHNNVNPFLHQVLSNVEVTASLYPEMQEARDVECASQSLQEMTSKLTQTVMPMRNSNGRRRKTGINALQSNVNSFLAAQLFSQKEDLENTPPTSFASVQSPDSAHAVSHGKAVDSATQSLQQMTSKPTQTVMPMKYFKRPMFRRFRTIIV